MVNVFRPGLLDSCIIVTSASKPVLTTLPLKNCNDSLIWVILDATLWAPAELLSHPDAGVLMQI
jgi:hypothetical protein